MNAEQIRERYQQQLDRIQANRAYSDHAKKVLCAKAWTQAAQQLEQQRQAELAELSSRREQLNRKMFGSTGTADPSTVLARRDAADRAAAIDNPRIAAETLQRAERDGDRTLAQAVAAHANTYGWTEVVDQYAASTPAFADAAKEWNSLPGTGDDFWETKHGMQFLLAKPSPIANLDDHQASALATEDMEAA
ncbi:hypothetical protein [Streptomyces sp. NBC_01264]|uniref:hypothetical protein n=1 Tax=Streptomyces sp. NBC_01264 TaxID=2903804 RepID=UPI00225060BD|nr:hypothetical protein [Streptomyces sp. NBC_01264]MCX4780909.1 hypothetical protein [Streptomyces sp. NBC_01264]